MSRGVLISFHALAAIALAAMSPTGADAAPGDLDPSFGMGGKVLPDSARCGSGAHAAEAQLDGGVLIASSYGVVGHRRCKPGQAIVRRLLPGGGFDPAFGGDGAVEVGAGGAPRDLALYPDGRFVTVSGGVVVRYDARGALDPNFGDGGSVAVPRDGIALNTAAIAPDGSVLVGGNSGSSALVGRYSDAGELDQEFGTGGFTSVNLSDARIPITSLAIQEDGAILAGAPYAAGYGYGKLTAIAILRFQSNGEPDPSFGNSGGVGVASSDRTAGLAQGDVDIALQPDGMIVAAGQLNEGIAIVRLTPAGGGDPSFSGDGLVELGKFFPKEGLGRVSAASLTPTGEILVGGTVARVRYPERSTPYATREQFALARVMADGSLDPTVSGDGKVNSDFLTGDDASSDAAFASSGLITVVGRASNGRRLDETALARYLTGAGKSDADADGFLDRRDKCADAYGARHDGCPRLASEVTFAYDSRRYRFEGTVSSRYEKCLDNARVTIFRARPGADRGVLSMNADYDGRYVIRYGAPVGRYYAKLRSFSLGGEGTCSAERSRTLVLP